MNFTVRPADPAEPPVAALLDRLARMHGSLYPPDSNNLVNAPDLDDPAFFFLAACDEAGTPVGVASFKREPGYVEIKRVFVDERWRGTGAAQVLVRALEERAAAEGYPEARLETGPLQPRAVAFYARLGYRERGPFGPYRADPNSLFMAKVLGRRPSAGT